MSETEENPYRSPGFDGVQVETPDGPHRRAHALGVLLLGPVCAVLWGAVTGALVCAICWFIDFSIGLVGESERSGDAAVGIAALGGVAGIMSGAVTGIICSTLAVAAFELSRWTPRVCAAISGCFGAGFGFMGGLVISSSNNDDQIIVAVTISVVLGLAGSAVSGYYLGKLLFWLAWAQPPQAASFARTDVDSTVSFENTSQRFSP